MSIFWLILAACGQDDAPLPALPAVGAAPVVGENDDAAPEDEDDEDEPASKGPNEPPDITQVSMTPAVPSDETDLVVTTSVSDRDRDFVTVRHEWSVNGNKLIAESGSVLEAGLFKRGDVVKCVVVATDGKQESRSEQEVRIGNAPPAIEDKPSNVTSVDGLRLRASDPDGDVLTWRLEGAPYGMAINPRTGEIAYKGAKVDQGGAFTVSVIVSDGFDGESRWTFSAEVQPGTTDEQATIEGQLKELQQAQAAPKAAEDTRKTFSTAGK